MYFSADSPQNRKLQQQLKVKTTAEDHARKLATMSTAQILKSQPQPKKVHDEKNAVVEKQQESNGKKSEVQNTMESA